MLTTWDVDVPVKAEMYLPYRQMKTFPFYRPRDLVIRTTGDPMNLIASVRNEIHAVDPDQPLANVATLDELLDEETQSRSVGMILLIGRAACRERVENSVVAVSLKKN